MAFTRGKSAGDTSKPSERKKSSTRGLRHIGNQAVGSAEGQSRPKKDMSEISVSSGMFASQNLCKFIMRFEEPNEEEAEVETEEKVKVLNMRIERSMSCASHYESDEESRKRRLDRKERVRTHSRKDGNQNLIDSREGSPG